ncbi:transglycosylase domain-containing protein [Deinococcus sp. A31D244]|uniref:peptidoglycan glycosyltransferase n=1 Tax=Deinococcus aquaticus TaxID=328692 RepID=A0ABY7V0G5_9DEIO|nr:transglycosylase domain-containing protein [Deinococcus aquaticus]WDA58662.1 transglycosylase domain-containing protein [Deinococcus aquaticus]
MIFLGRFLKFLTSFVLAALVAGVGVAATYGLKWTRELPDYRELDNLTRSLGAETKVFARDNTPLGSLIPRVGEQAISRTIVTLNEISPFMMAALISNEDRRFFEHYGLDPYGLGRQFQRAARGDSVQGGSTLTNQLIKNTLLLDEYQQARTPDRKFKEWMLSVQVERSFTKEEILQNYLNAIYWGDGGPVELYGIYAASQAYFRTTPKNLTLAQSAYLTVLVPSAGRYFDYKAARPLMRVLLTRMVEDRWITQAQMDAAWKENLQPRGWQVTYNASGTITSAKLVDRTQKELKAVTTVRAPHFMRQVENELVRRFGREKVYGSGGLRVYTTLDPKVQNAVETASREASGLPPGATLAATILNPYTGEVLGMIGQKLQGSAPPADWNNAAQGQRQIGSTIKPLLYTTALSTGLDQTHREEDRPITFPCTGCKDGVYAPQNFEGATTYRDMTIREALDRSLNLVTVRLADRIGLQTFFGKIRELGVAPNDGTGLAAALGAVETTPIKMAAAYAPFVNGGLYRVPRYLNKVTTARGEILYDASSEPVRPDRVWTPQIAWLGLDMIRGVVNDLTAAQGGLAERAKFGEWPVAGKTGTSNGPKDFWFVGTTPLYTGSVWVGRQQGGEMPTYYFSGYVNAPIWRRMMELAHAGQPVRQFSEPPGIQYVDAPDSQFLPGVKIAMLDPQYRDAANTDLQTDAPAPVQYRETGLATGSDPRTAMVSLDRVTNRLATEFTPPENIVQRRIEIEALPAYAPDPSPAPLKDEKADPDALKAAGSQGGAPASIPPATTPDTAPAATPDTAPASGTAQPATP